MTLLLVLAAVTFGVPTVAINSIAIIALAITVAALRGRWKNRAMHLQYRIVELETAVNINDKRIELLETRLNIRSVNTGELPTISE